MASQSRERRALAFGTQGTHRRIHRRDSFDLIAEAANEKLCATESTKKVITWLVDYCNPYRRKCFVDTVRKKVFTLFSICQLFSFCVILNGNDKIIDSRIAIKSEDNWEISWTRLPSEGIRRACARPAEKQQKRP